MVTSDERLTCEQAEEGFADLIEESLDTANSPAREHLRHCDACRQSFEKYRHVVVALGELRPRLLRRDLTGDINSRIDQSTVGKRLAANAYWVAAGLVLIFILLGVGYWLTGAPGFENASAAEARVSDNPVAQEQRDAP